MKLFDYITIKDSEVYCILSFGKPTSWFFGKEENSKFYPLTWPNTFVKETALQIEEEFPKEYSTLKPAEILHGCSDNFSSDPLDIRIKTPTTFIIRFIITDFLKYVTMIEERNKLIKHIQTTLISIAQQECIKNSLAYNLKNINYINDALLQKAIEITRDFGIQVNSLETILKLSSETNELLKKYSNSKIEGISSMELEKALYFVKGAGIKKLAEALGIDDSIMVYKIESLSQTLKRSNYNFFTLNDQEKDLTQKVLSLFHSTQNT